MMKFTKTQARSKRKEFEQLQLKETWLSIAWKGNIGNKSVILEAHVHFLYEMEKRFYVDFKA